MESALSGKHGRISLVRVAASVVVVLCALLVGGCTEPAPKSVDIVTANKDLDTRYIGALLHNDIEALMDTILNSPDVFEVEMAGRYLDVRVGRDGTWY